MTESIQASVDIILYPSKEDYISTIADFIDRTGQYPDVHITLNDQVPSFLATTTG